MSPLIVAKQDSVTEVSGYLTMSASGSAELRGHPCREACTVSKDDTVLVLLNLPELDGDVASFVATLRSAFREAGAKVLLVARGVISLDEDGRSIGPSGSSLSELVPSTSSIFASTSIDFVLRRLTCRHVVIAGGTAEGAVETSTRDAADVGYMVTVVADALSSSSAATHARALYNMKGFARIRTVADVCSELQLTGPPPHQSLPNHPANARTALVVIDVQYKCASRGEGMHNAAHAGGGFDFYGRVEDVMVPNIQKLLRRARALNGVEVIFTTIENLTVDGRDRSLDYKLSDISVPKGHKDGRVSEEIAPRGDEICLPKTAASVFMSTTIDYVLRNLGVTRLVMVGMITNQCVESAARDALDRGYEVVLVDDATTAHNPEDQAAAEESIRRLGGDVTSTSDVLSSPDGALAAPPGSRVLHVAVLRPEDNEEYGTKILPAFQQLFNEAVMPADTASCGEDGGTPSESSHGDASRVALGEGRQQHVVELFDFDVKVKGVYPEVETWGDYDGFLIPGSGAGAYEDLPWVHNLAEYIRRLHRDRRKMVGVCFGHQIIAHALGGKVVKSSAGLTYGCREFELTPDGMRRLSNELSAHTGSPKGTVSLLYHHNDIVVEMPEGARLLGSDPRVFNHGFVVGEHVMTLQGHPEFVTSQGMVSLCSILTKEGLQSTRWGQDQQTDSVQVARVILTYMCS